MSAARHHVPGRLVPIRRTQPAREERPMPEGLITAGTSHRSPPTSGTGTVLGEPLGKTAGYLHRVGALIESPAFHPAVSPQRPSPMTDSPVIVNR